MTRQQISLIGGSLYTAGKNTPMLTKVGENFVQIRAGQVRASNRLLVPHVTFEYDRPSLETYLREHNLDFRLAYETLYETNGMPIFRRGLVETLLHQNSTLNRTTIEQHLAAATLFDQNTLDALVATLASQVPGLNCATSTIVKWLQGETKLPNYENAQALQLLFAQVDPDYAASIIRGQTRAMHIYYSCFERALTEYIQEYLGLIITNGRSGGRFSTAVRESLTNFNRDEVMGNLVRQIIERHPEGYVVAVAGNTEVESQFTNDAELRAFANRIEHVYPLEIFNILDLIYQYFDHVLNHAFATTDIIAREIGEVTDIVTSEQEIARWLDSIRRVRVNITEEQLERIRQYYRSLKELSDDSVLRDATRVAFGLVDYNQQDYALGALILGLGSPRDFEEYHRARNIRIPLERYRSFSMATYFLISIGYIDNVLNHLVYGFRDFNLQKMLKLCRDAATVVPYQALRIYIFQHTVSPLYVEAVRELKRDSPNTFSYLFSSDIMRPYMAVRERNRRLKLSRYIRDLRASHQESPWTNREIARYWRLFGFPDLQGILVAREGTHFGRSNSDSVLMADGWRVDFNALIARQQQQNYQAPYLEALVSTVQRRNS